MNNPGIRKYLRVLIFIIFVSGLVFSDIQTVEAVSPADIDLSSNYARNSILSLAEKNIISGDSMGNFMPHAAVIRSRMVVMLVKALGINTVNIPDKPTFKDVPKSHWAYKYIEAAYREGIVTGLSKDIFGVDEKCTRQQIAAIIGRSFKLSAEVRIKEQDYSNVNQLRDKNLVSSWAKDAVEFSLSNGLMKGTGNSTFSPESTAEMEQAAVIIDRIITNRESIESSINTANKGDNTSRSIGIKLNDDLANVHYIVKNGEILIPAQTFEYLQAEVSINSQTGLIMIEKAQCAPNNKYGNILFQEGNPIAFKNHTGAADPYRNSQGADTGTISLSAVPEIQNNEAFVPAMAVCYSLGIDAHYNYADNVLIMGDGSTGKNPYLYTVIRKSLLQNGAFNLDFMMNLDNKKTDASLDMNFNVSGLVNGENANMKSSFVSSVIPYDKYEFPNMNINKQYDITKTTDKYIVRHDGSTEEKPLYMLRNSGVLASDLNDIWNKNGNLLELIHSNIPAVKQISNVSMNGTTAARFVIELHDQDSIKTFLGTDYFPEIAPISNFYIPKAEYESDGSVLGRNDHPSTIDKVIVELLVSRDNRIVNQKISYSGIRSVYFTTSYPMDIPSPDDPEEVSFTPMLHTKNRVVGFHVSYDVTYSS